MASVDRLCGRRRLRAVERQHVGGRDRGTRTARRHVRQDALASATDTGETYDLVIVGAGSSGTVAAYTFLKETGRQKTCLLLDNHPIIGGEAKRNEFVVRGQRLIGPQGVERR